MNWAYLPNYYGVKTTSCRSALCWGRLMVKWSSLRCEFESLLSLQILLCKKRLKSTKINEKEAANIQLFYNERTTMYVGYITKNEWPLNLRSQRNLVDVLRVSTPHIPLLNVPMFRRTYTAIKRQQWGQLENNCLIHGQPLFVQMKDEL